MLVVDRWFLSRLGKEALAASMSGGLSSHVLTSLLSGLIGYVSVLVAQYYGAKKNRMCGPAVIQAIYLSFICYPILICFIPTIKYVFIVAKQELLLRDLATIYARTLLAGSVFFIIRTAVGGFFIGIGRTTIVMIANLIGILINIPLNFILIFGKFGLPNMGIQGAALGTVCASSVSCIILLGVYSKEISEYPFKTKKLLKFRFSIIKKLLSFGLPAGLDPFLTLFAFNIYLQIMHSYGPNTAGAITIAFTWHSVVFLPMVGLGITARTITGQNMGANNPDEAKRMTNLILSISIVYAIVMMVIFNGLTDFLMSVFAVGMREPNDEMQQTTKLMLHLISIVAVADSCKLVLGGSLRGAGDTAWVMWFSISIHWFMAICVVVLVKLLKVNQYIAFSMLIIMSNIDFLSKLYRFRTRKWRNIKLIS